MANEPTPGEKPFPSAKGGASDDDIFAEMGRILAQDHLGAAPAKPAAPKAPPPGAGAGNDQPLELTHVVKPGKPQPAKPVAPPPAAPAPQAAAPAPATPPAPPTPAAAKPAPPPAAPAAATTPAQGTKIGDAVAMLDGQPKAAAGVTVSTRSLDSLVQDLARPMIQDWIGKNLERIVREEAAKAVAKAAPKA